MKLLTLSTPYLLNLLAVFLLLSNLSEAISSRKGRHSSARLSHHPGQLREKLSNNLLQSKTKANGSACGEAPPAQAKAPKKNVWAQLTIPEVVQVKEWLYTQKDLNLSKDGIGAPLLSGIELLLPNKSEVLLYLDGDGPEPARYARAELYSADYTSEIFVGPLPISNATAHKTTWQPLTFLHTRKNPKIVGEFPPGLYDLQTKLHKSAEDIFRGLYPGINRTVLETGDTIPAGDGKTAMWATLWSSEASFYGLGESLPLGVSMGIEWATNNPLNLTLSGWLYDNVLYPTTEAFRAAYNNGSLPKFPADKPGEWDAGGHHGEAYPLDKMAPPQAIAPSGSRFSIDEEARYVEWMGFSFYMALTPRRGWLFYDIRHKGRRILYELSLQELLAHYAGADPAKASTVYRDAGQFGASTAIQELVPGYDCPVYAEYLNTTAPGDSFGETFLLENSVCFFEYDADFPISRHSNGNYMSATKNVYFVVRFVYTFGNYDYMFSYEFYLDGSIRVSARASGYFLGQYFLGNEEYGYRLHEALSGSMHDHVLNFKADFDILGTANTLQTTSFVPTAEKYVWSPNVAFDTFKLKREIIESEDNSRLSWDRATQYTVVNTDSPNKWGEYRGYRVLPVDGTTHLTNNVSSVLLNCVYPYTFDLAVTKQKDTEPTSVDPNDITDCANPIVNFNEFFDGESLKQEDLVVWFNLGMHHLPHTGDLPLTLETTAHAAIQFQPLNYYVNDISTETLSQVEVDFRHENVSAVKTFGQNPALCSENLAKEAPNLHDLLYAGLANNA